MFYEFTTVHIKAAILTVSTSRCMKSRFLVVLQLNVGVLLQNVSHNLPLASFILSIGYWAVERFLAVVQLGQSLCD